MKKKKPSAPNTVFFNGVDFGSSHEETNVFSIVFAVLPSRKKETYFRLLPLIFKAVPEWKPQEVNVHFKTAGISAFRETFCSPKLLETSSI